MCDSGHIVSPSRLYPCVNATEYLTPDEIRLELRTTTATVRRWLRDGELPYVELPSGDRIVAREDLDRWLRQRRVEVLRP